MNSSRLVIVFVILAILAFALPLQARESRIVDGDGLLTEDMELAGSIWRLGLCPIIPDDEYGFEVANMAYSIWPGAFAESKAFSAICIDDLDPATLSPNDIVEIGEAYGVDALLCGRVIQAKFRTSAWTALSNTVRTEVRVSIAFDLYETATGTLIWERTLKKDRTVPQGHSSEILRRFAGNISEDMVPVLIEDGITGRDISINEPPHIDSPFTSLVFATSAVFFTGLVTDDFAVDEVTLSCGAGEDVIRMWTADACLELPIDTILTREELHGDELVVVARDSLGVETHAVFPIEDAKEQITGQIANISADSVFINLGVDDGVLPGMVFTVQADVEITDPATGETLGSSTLNVGLLVVTSVDAEFSTCEVIEGRIEDIQPGNTVY